MPRSEAWKLAIRKLVLTTYQQESANEFTREIRSLFTEARRVERDSRQIVLDEVRRLRVGNPTLSRDNLFALAIQKKRVMTHLLRWKRRQSVFYQCILLQVSGWLKSCYSSRSRLLAEYSNKTEGNWVGEFRKLGPKFGTSNWADAVEVAANYVRHKDEWRFKTHTFDKHLGRLVAVQDIIGTMPTGRERKNAQFLINLGVSQTELFGFGNDACGVALKLIGSNSADGLKRNCEKWLQSLDAFTEREFRQLIQGL